MRIVYIGNFEISFTTENHIAQELESLGHEVIRRQENQTEVEDLLRLDKTVTDEIVIKEMFEDVCKETK